MKNLQNLKGAKRLNKLEQKSIQGGNNSCGYRKYWCDFVGACITVDIACPTDSPSPGGPGGSQDR